jgi:NAD(P)-dependent dehydrogenase (short-subunit alcohol dehydrogenase family)
VTGAAKGIGQAIALRLASEGCDVVVAGRRLAGCEVVAHHIRDAYGCRSLALEVDVASVPAIRAMVTRAAEEMGHIDILVNNAGIIRPHSLREVTEEDWDEMMSLSARGLFFCVQLAAPALDWCREHGTGTAYIEPGSPWQNPYVESFNGKLRDELFSREVFDTIMEARLLFDDWCDTYNRHRPHSALGYLPPAVFAAAFNQPKLS